MFAEIRDSDAAFAAVQVDPELGTLVWPEGADIDPTCCTVTTRPPKATHLPPESAIAPGTSL